MKLLFVAIAVAALSAATVTAVTVPPPIPGLCVNGAGAVGCSFDATKLDPTVMIQPLAQVVDFSWCNETCYEPGHQFDPGCTYCEFTNPVYPDLHYSVPTNVMVSAVAESGGCYEQDTTATMHDYNNLVGHTVGGGGWFSSWSKTTVKFYHEYFEEDSSLTLQSMYILWHSLTIPSFLPVKMFWQFAIAVDSLPATYNETTYRTFIEQYGTHYMTSAHVGGAAVLTDYFHSCFLQEYGGQYVSSESSSSFFGLFSHHSSSHSGHNATGAKFKSWSQPTMRLVGGDSDKYGVLNWTNTMDEAECQAWTDSVKYNQAPLNYQLAPLTDLMTDATVKANMETALVAYGAEITNFKKQLQQSLVPKDPYKVPSWCHYSPHPPGGPTRRLQEQATPPALPGCPALPSMDDVNAAFMARMP